MSGRYVNLGDVRTWFEESGSGEPLVLLHPGGAGVDSRAFGPHVEGLAEHFRVFTPERRGHGRTADVPGPITFQAMAEDTARFIDTVVGGPTRLLGYSDGAIVALLVALHRPDLVSRLVFIAGVFQYGGWLPEVLASLDEPPQFLRDSYAELSPDGPEHFDEVAQKLAEMHLVEPDLQPSELARIECRVLLMFGDDDEVTLEHAIALYRALPEAELAVIPRTSHGLMVERPKLCNAMIVEFLLGDPTPTVAPVRRAGDRP